jgi:hypothetical protein
MASVLVPFVVDSSILSAHPTQSKGTGNSLRSATEDLNIHLLSFLS